MKIRPVQFTFGLANHAFWYYEDRIGQKGTLSAGPNRGKLQTILDNAFLNSFTASPPGIGHFKADLPLQPTVFDGKDEDGADVCFSVDIMEFAASVYTNGVVPYDALDGPNSNSFARALGEDYGFFTVPQPPRTPGWNVEVPF